MEIADLPGRAARLWSHPVVRRVREETAAEAEGPVYLVGGALRDSLLDRPVLDFDFVVRGDAGSCARRLATRLGARFILLHEDWGVARLVWRTGDGQGEPATLDFAPMQGRSIEEDLSQRDFTVNAMALELTSARASDPSAAWKDPWGGSDDLREKKIRMLKASGFRRDPVRMLRAFRLASTLQFVLDADTRAAVEEHRALIRSGAAERIGDELFKFLGTRASFGYLVQMDGSGLLTALFPELEALKGLGQGRWHRRDGWDHTLECYRVLEVGLTVGFPQLEHRGEEIRAWIQEGRRTEALLKLAALLHDIGKPATRSVDAGGEVHFYGHAREGSRMAAALLARIRSSRQDRERVQGWVRHHLGPLLLTAAAQRGRLPDRAKLRFLRKLGAEETGVLLLSLADLEASGGGESPQARRASLCAVIDSLFGLLAEMKRLAAPSGRLVSGHDLMDSLGLGPGPLIGRLLRRIEEERIQGKVRDREDALNLARSLLEAGVFAG